MNKLKSVKPIFKLMILYFAFLPFGWAQLFSGEDLSPKTIADVIGRLQVGDILIIGEQHYHHQSTRVQLELLKSLRDQKSFLIHVGMEFISFTQQEIVDAFRRGEIEESIFWQKLDWRPEDIPFYKDQMLFPQKDQGEFLLAINAPRWLTGKIAKLGLDSLSWSEQLMLPPNFSLGNDFYFERFKKALDGVKDPKSIHNYFAAQSVWDDTMAFQATQFMDQFHKNSILVIIVGEFHVAYGGGLPHQLKKRYSKGHVWTLSLLQQNEALEEWLPIPQIGPRADWIYVIP